MIHDRSTFENSYAGQSPWDIGKPQKPFMDVADQITGTVLDAGCGTGDTKLFFAGRGGMVTGNDIIEEAINRARRKEASPGHWRFIDDRNGARLNSSRALQASWSCFIVDESVRCSCNPSKGTFNGNDESPRFGVDQGIILGL
jgi:SAM-dependent methyltransferase